MLDYSNLSRDVAPQQLLMGITACGGVEEYYNYCIHQEKAQYKQFAQFAALSGDPQQRYLAPYPDNAHEVIEQEVTETQRKTLGITEEFLSAGLVTPLPNWWAVPSLRRGRKGHAGRSHRTMVPDSRGERFVLQRDGVSWPIYCTWSNFSFDARELAIGQRMGTPLEVDHVADATYNNLEAWEDQIVNGLTDEQGSAMTIDGIAAPGLLSTGLGIPTFDYSTWTGLTGAQIVEEVLGAIELIRITHPGPYTLFVPGNYSIALNKKYSTAYDSGTVRMALEELGPYRGRTLKVVLADTLPDNRVVLMQMDKRAVDLVVGQQNVPLSWKDNSGLNTFWVVLSCVIFRMFANKDGDYGLVVGNLT